MKNYAILLHNKTSFSQKTITVKIVTIFCLSILFFIIVGFTIGSLTKHPNIVEKNVYSDKVLIERYNTPFSETALKELLISLKVKHIDIVMTQAKIESSHYKSQVFVENNNLFGMRMPHNRITTAIGENLKHAVFKSWQDSALDYAIYQSTFLKNKTQEEYLAYLHANYAENKAYVSMIQKMKN